MDIEWYRDKIMHAPKYNNSRWHDRCMRMSPGQVLAVYYKFKETGELTARTKKQIAEDYHQITLSEYFGKDMYASI